MIVIITGVEFESRLTAIEVVSGNQPGCFKLSQNTVDGGQTHITTLFQQDLVHVLGAEVLMLPGLLENFENT